MQNQGDALTPFVAPPLAAGRPQYLPPYPKKEQVSLADIWFTLWKHRFAAGICAAVIFALVALYTFVTKPLYESVAQIRVDSSQRGGLGLEELIAQRLPDSDNEGGRLQTEVQILQSRTVSLQVIKNLELAHKPQFAGEVLARQLSTTDAQQMQPQDREELLRIFERSENISVVPKTRILEIRFRSTDPQLATDVVNGILEAYVQRNFQSKYQGSMQVANWVSKQMEELKADAARAQQQLAEFQKQHNILGTDENNNIVIDRLRQLNQQLADGEAERIVKEARYRLASSGDPELVANVVPSTTLHALRTQEAELKAQFAQLDAKFGAGYPKVREVQVQLAKLGEAITLEVSNVGQRLHEEFLAASNSENMLRREFETQKQAAFRLNESAVQFATLKHEVESTQELSDTLQLKLKQAGLMAGLASADISVVDRGLVPARPAFPKKGRLLLVGFLVAMFGGVSLAFVLEAVNDTLETTEEVEGLFALPALAAVPLIKARDLPEGEHRGRRRRGQFGVGTVTARQPASLLAEPFHAICNSVLLATPERPPRVLVVTSAMPSEGKSTISCNLAIALAQRGGRVLLLDADLRRSSLNSHLGLETGPTAGLSSILAGACESDPVKTPVPELPNLQFISAGPRAPCPSELLASARMKAVLERWIGEYDSVVIDTSPVLSTADSLPLAAKADAVLLVMRSGQSTRRAFTRMYDLLFRAKARVVGVIVNGVDIRLEPYSSGYDPLSE